MDIIPVGEDGEAMTADVQSCRLERGGSRSVDGNGCCATERTVVRPQTTNHRIRCKHTHTHTRSYILTDDKWDWLPAIRYDTIR